MLLLKQKFREIAQVWSNIFCDSKILWNHNLKAASTGSNITPNLIILLLIPYSRHATYDAEFRRTATRHLCQNWPFFQKKLPRSRSIDDESSSHHGSIAYHQ